MKKLIMLTFLVCCVTIFFVGCENGNININNLISGELGQIPNKSDEIFSSGEEEKGESRK